MRNFYPIFSLLVLCSLGAAQTNPVADREKRSHLRPRLSSAPSTQLYVSFPEAGTPNSSGYAGDTGPATAAQLSNPLSLATDAQGDVYIYDYANNVIREVVAATGVISTVVGNSTLGPGFSGDGQPATSAQFAAAQGMAVDSAGNLYIADGPNARVRVVNSAGIISTFAGNGSYGDAGDGGPATNATLDYPVGVAVDPAGDVYIADYGNSTVRKVAAATGIITTVAGIDSPGLQNYPGEGGLATQAFLGLPYAVAVDGVGDLFILDVGSSTIQKVGTDGIINTFVSNVSSSSLATDPAGNLYYADYLNDVVNQVLPDGTVNAIAGISGTSGYTGDGGPASLAEYASPYGIAVDSSGNLYVSDFYNSVVRELNPVAPPNVVVANGGSDVGYSAPDTPLPIAAGEIVTIFGTNIGFTVQATAQPDANGIYENNFAYTTVTFNGIPGPVLISGPTYVSAIVPYELSGSGSVPVNIVVSLFGQTTATAVIPYTDAPSPGVFTGNSTGVLGGLPITNTGGGSLPENPTSPGGEITLYVTGEGQTSPGGVDGLVTNGPVFPQPLQPVSVTIGGQAATVISATEAQGQVAGVLQVNVTVPSGLAASNSTPLQVTVGSVTSPVTPLAVN